MTTSEKNIATLLHLGALTQYFFPFGNFIVPAVIWSSKKEASQFIDQNGRSVLNFQLSLLLYVLVLFLIGVVLTLNFLFGVQGNINIDHNHFQIDGLENHPFTTSFVVGLTAIVLGCFLKFVEIVLIIYGAVKASNGIVYTYPLALPFFKTTVQSTVNSSDESTTLLANN